MRVKDMFYGMRATVDGNSCHPWSRPLDVEDPIEWIHGYARRVRHRQMRRAIGDRAWVAPRALQRLTWWALSLKNATALAREARRKGTRTSLEAVGDVASMMRLATRENLAPFTFYLYGLHEPKNRSRARRLLSDWEFAALAREFSRSKGLSVGSIDNKVQFTAFCEKHGLPTPRSYTPEEWLQTDPDRLPSHIFIKPSGQYGGNGCLRLQSAPGNEPRWEWNEESLSRDELHARLILHFGTSDFIIQSNLKNHRDLLDLSPDSLSTLRVMTGLDASGAPTAFRAVLRLGSTGAIVDNFTQGGMIVPVALETGRLGPGKCRNGRKEWIHHPQSGAPIDGRILPHWDALLALCERAQACAEGFNFLGWDIAITDSGPVLIECNVWSQINVLQVASGRSLLEDNRFVAAFLREIRLVEKLASEGTSALARVPLATTFPDHRAIPAAKQTAVAF